MASRRPPLSRHRNESGSNETATVPSEKARFRPKSEKMPSMESEVRRAIDAEELFGPDVEDPDESPQRGLDVHAETISAALAQGRATATRSSTADRKSESSARSRSNQGTSIARQSSSVATPRGCSTISRNPGRRRHRTLRRRRNAGSASQVRVRPVRVLAVASAGKPAPRMSSRTYPATAAQRITPLLLVSSERLSRRREGQRSLAAGGSNFPQSEPHS